MRGEDRRVRIRVRMGGDEGVVELKSLDGGYSVGDVRGALIEEIKGFMLFDVGSCLASSSSWWIREYICILF